mmetsp:Transcript_1981/g.3051  ORF Transcript_1981/g.3051 Transcript_1981/m.3051 type:complete len:373 (-) Transcript_1981:3129-4247(-)
MGGKHLANVRMELLACDKLEGKYSWCPLPQDQRENDSFLMSEFIYKGFKKGELELINQCRIYHQVMTVTDIATADGATIDSLYTKSRGSNDRVSSLQWPIQNNPSSKAWGLWKRALQYLQYKGKLITPLGKWKTRPHQRWSWVVRLSDMVLFHRSQQGWVQFQPVRIGGAATRSASKPWFFRNESNGSSSPTGEIAAATPYFNEMDGDMFTITWSPRFPTATRVTTGPSRPLEDEDSISPMEEEELRVHSLQQSFLHGVNASAYFKRLVGPIQTPSEEDLLEIVTNLLSGQLLVCSDGSFYSHSGTGSHAWVFATAAGQILLQGAGPIDCHPKQLSSYRPELGGITSLLFLLTVIAQISDIDYWRSITIYWC